MKTTLSFILLSLLTLQTLSAAEEIYIPAISKPDILQEGVQRQLSPAQIAELLPWSKDSKLFLLDLIDSLQGISTQDKIDRLEYGIKQVALVSAPKHSELLMRYTLHRALVIKDLLTREMESSAIGSEDAKLRVLLSSIKMAIKYSDVDMKTLTTKTAPDFQAFGEEYFLFLSELNKSIFDASAQYAIQRTSLEWLQWDLYRDLNNTLHASKIVKINNSLKMFPTTKQSDVQYLKHIQGLKKVSSQLGITGTIGTRDDRQVKQEIIESDSNAIRYAYSTYYNQCFPKSVSGDLMILNKVSDSYCAKKNAYVYSTHSNKCYKKSHTNEIMLSSEVEDSLCAMPDSYVYSTYYSLCFKKSNTGDIMVTSPVEFTKCQNR